jgi:predicted O-methyltransferase YrrM
VVEIALVAAKRALDIDLDDISRRSSPPANLVSIYPGEHYRLLSALVDILDPALVVEIGTYTGLSALAMLRFMRATARLITYDILRWDTFDATVLRRNDFDDGRLQQRLDDLADPSVFRRNADVLAAADLIFVDGPKDGQFEWKFLRMLRTIQRPASAWLVFDDIRLWKMVDWWRSLDLPKFDATSLGHWSGTGIIKLSPS